MLLDRRKLLILQAIIDDYIASAEPVGSRTIAKKYTTGLSSATIRNEMSDLEEMGYLEQPHTSSGRIPLDKAYRLYVDKLMKHDELPQSEADLIKSLYEKKSAEFDDIISQTAKVLCNLTNYTSLVTAPQLTRILIKSIQLVQIDERKALMIVVTSAGILKDIFIDLPSGVRRDDLHRISNMLSDVYGNKTFAEADLTFLPVIRKEMLKQRDFFNSLIDILSEKVLSADSREIYLEGTTNIFNYPEYYDMLKARDFLKLMENKILLAALLKGSDKTDLSITIGAENQLNELKSYSIISASYKVGDQTLGTIAVIGPKRMEYSRAISAIELVCKNLSGYLSKMLE